MKSIHPDQLAQLMLLIAEASLIVGQKKCNHLNNRHKFRTSLISYLCRVALLLQSIRVAKHRHTW